jgi:protein involved in polysaccharide export with SLBB domain
MSISLKAAFTLSVLAVFQVSYGQNQQLSPELLNQLNQKYSTNYSSSEAAQYLKKLNSNPDSLIALRNKPSDKADSLNDSTLKVDTISKADTFSVYEKLLRGDNINPDSLLSRLSVFGYDVFKKNKPSTFAPTDFSTVPADYCINVGDEVVCMLWGRMNEEYRLKVSRDGSINIPHFGPVNVAGLPFSALEKNILNRIGNIEGVNATISMGQLRSVGVYIVGEVASPGYYTISALSNVTNALFAAGGPTKNGSLRTIQLRRNGKEVSDIDFYDFLMSGSDRTGLRLQSGDVIHVPIVKSMAAIVGNVRRSALYELKGATNLSDLINLAGGITPAAWVNKIQVERFSDNNYRVVLDIDSAKGKIPDFKIKDGDIVKIFPVLLKDNNAVYLSGNVLRPGKYEFKDGMRVHDIISDYKALLDNSYFDYATIVRQEPPSYIKRIVSFNLKNSLDNPQSQDNINLMALDQVIIYNRDFFEPDRFINIEGAVTNPGKYVLFDNMKVRDLILQAGGLSEDASPIRGEIYRRDSQDESVTTKKITFAVDLAMKDNSDNNLTLQRLDRVYIRSKMGWETERKVTLDGQFKYPGTYVLFEGENLGNLIDRAGGFKDDAYLSAAVFTRVSVKKLEQQRYQEYNDKQQSDIMKLSAEMAAKQNSDASQLLLQQASLQNKLSQSSFIGRVVVDLNNPKNYSDFALEDGDTLFVPRNLNTISVIGEVFNPATFKFEGSDVHVSTYVESAGGLKSTADKKHIYIIKANGRIVTNKQTKILRANLEPGDAIVVPQSVKYSNPQKLFVDTADAIFKIASTVGTIITTILLARSLH